MTQTHGKTGASDWDLDNTIHANTILEIARLCGISVAEVNRFRRTTVDSCVVSLAQRLQRQNGTLLVPTLGRTKKFQNGTFRFRMVSYCKFHIAGCLRLACF